MYVGYGRWFLVLSLTCEWNLREKQRNEMKLRKFHLEEFLFGYSRYMGSTDGVVGCRDIFPEVRTAGRRADGGVVHITLVQNKRLHKKHDGQYLFYNVNFS